MDRKHQLELLDSAHINSTDLNGNLQDIAGLNRLTGSTKAVIAAISRMAGRHSGPLSIIDIGTGAGDLPTGITRWAAQRGICVQTYGADLQTHILNYARQHSTATGWLQLDGTALPVANTSID